MKTFSILSAFALSVACLVSTASAATMYDQDVTPDVIVGSGNANGGYTTDRTGNLELGLRGKLRFNSSNQPENTFNSNGDGSYTFQAGNPPTGFGFDPNNPTTPVWNFEWSINTDYLSSDNSSTAQLDDYTYELRMDADPGAGTIFETFDLINQPYFDHSIGNNTTGNGQGVEATSPAEYSTLISLNNVAQNSWNYEFFNDSPSALAGFNPNVPGVYRIELEAFDIVTGLSVGSTGIDVNVVPEPTSLALAGLGLCGLATFRRRRRA